MVLGGGWTGVEDRMGWQWVSPVGTMSASMRFGFTRKQGQPCHNAVTEPAAGDATKEGECGHGLRGSWEQSPNPCSSPEGTPCPGKD